jgi:outer membrane receptor protein involved in Fe transport
MDGWIWRYFNKVFLFKPTPLMRQRKSDNQSPHIGAPIADALSPGDLDMESVEIIRGVASAIYGMNATNGLANFITKDPFLYPGLSVQQTVAINHVNDRAGRAARLYTQTNLRWAFTVQKRWGVKVTLGYNKGYDWIADNYADLNAQANVSTGLLGNYNPGYDGVNSYGNESSNRRTLSLNGKNYVIARTGYAEKDVVDYRLQNKKGDVSIYFQAKTRTTIQYTYRVAVLNNVYQRSNRFQLANYVLQQHVLRYKSPVVQANMYLNRENTGDSYNLRSMAENLDLGFKGTTNWYNDYTRAFNGAGNSIGVAEAHALARNAADFGRPIPGSERFENKLNELQDINNWDYGAALKVKANLLHGEVKIDLAQLLKIKYQLQVGADLRDYVIVPDGNYFINPTDSVGNLNYVSYGFFVHAAKRFFNDRLQVSGVLRATQYEYFNLKSNPRFTAVYNVTNKQALRISYQNAYRFPSIFEGFSNINSGGVKRVGGLKIMSNGVFENLWLKSSIDAFVSAVNTDVNSAGMSQTSAIQKNQGILKRSDYTYIKPERLHSFEVGYRMLLLQNHLVVDLDFYYNLYSDFIAQIEGSVPTTNDNRDIAAALYDRTRQNRYRVWTNSKSKVRNFGAEMEARYLLSKSYTLFANTSYQTLRKTDEDDGLEDGFNTPSWIVNGGITGEKVYQSLGFSITGKYQSKYYWQSFLVNGDVPSIFNIDAMLMYTINKLGIQLKIGGTNILNKYYYSILGGPQIGAHYYTQLILSL